MMQILASHEYISHVSPDFDCVHLKSSMGQFTLPPALCDTSAYGVT